MLFVNLCGDLRRLSFEIVLELVLFDTKTDGLVFVAHHKSIFLHVVLTCENLSLLSDGD